MTHPEALRVLSDMAAPDRAAFALHLEREVKEAEGKLAWYETLRDEATDAQRRDLYSRSVVSAKAIRDGLRACAALAVPA